MPMTPTDIMATAASSSVTATSAAAAAVTVTIPGVAFRQNVIDSLALSASGAASGPITMTITDGPIVTAPTITGAVATSGGTFAAGAYFWKITAVTQYGESVGSNEVTATLALNGTQTLSWTASPAAVVTGYRIYRGTAAGAENVLVGFVSAMSGTSFTDTGAAGSAATVPAANTSNIAFALDQSLAVPAAPFILNFPGGGLAGNAGNAMAVTVSAGAASCVIKSNVIFQTF